LWKTALPPGHSSPAVFGDRVFLTAVRDKRLWTIGLDRATGEILWEREAPHQGLELIHQIGSHAQPSPATDGSIVVSFFGSAGLFCYDFDGKLIWKRPMARFSNTYGAACSPIIVNDRVILNQDHDIDSHLLCLDKSNGDTVWKTDRSEFPRGYCSPIVWEENGRKQIIVVGALRVIGYDLRTGKEIWTVRGLARITNLTPVLGSGNVLYVAEWAPGGDETKRISADSWEKMAEQFDQDKSGTLKLAELPRGPLKARFPQIDRDKDDQITRAEWDWMQVIFNTAQNATVAIKLGGRGDVTKTHVLWKRRKYVPYVPSPLYFEGSLLMVKNGGIVTCWDSKTGELSKLARVPNTGSYYSSPVMGDGKIYLINQSGKLAVLSADADWEVLSTAEFREETYATPAIADGRIYIRTSGHLYCLGLK
jgi:outer membrane protein assembly factor BamB